LRSDALSQLGRRPLIAPDVSEAVDACGQSDSDVPLGFDMRHHEHLSSVSGLNQRLDGGL
jgi:hypothetical protein